MEVDQLEQFFDEITKQLEQKLGDEEIVTLLGY